MFKLKANEFQYIKPLTWPEVFAIWRKTEAGNPNWEAHYKERGFTSWQEWRRKYSEPLKCEDREWHLYRILDPKKSVPEFHGGPLKGWKDKYYKSDTLPTFNELVQNPEVQQHGYILQLMNDFPKETIITGLVTKDGIVIIEGMHRCCAVALTAMRYIEIYSSISIVLAEFLEPELPILSTKNK